MKQKYVSVTNKMLHIILILQSNSTCFFIIWTCDCKKYHESPNISLSFKLNITFFWFISHFFLFLFCTFSFLFYFLSLLKQIADTLKFKYPASDAIFTFTTAENIMYIIHWSRVEFLKESEGLKGAKQRI